MLCEYCDNLTIQTLFELAQTQIAKCNDALTFYRCPQDAFYRHHPSYESLADSAHHGCEICTFILQEFRAFQDRRKNLANTAHILDIETEIYDKSRRNLPTDIRIFLNASYCFNSSDPQQIAMFDILLVQSGDNPMEEEEDFLSPVILKLSTTRQQEVVFDGRRIGQFQLNPNLGSEENFGIARQWLEECCNEHVCCPASTDALFPTRLIDVGSPDSSQTLEISKIPRLVVTSGQKGKYLALSHCWGGEMPVKLLGSNIQQFYEKLPVKELPANFQDAIAITRELGFQYLWIDSLCIIQDSRLDWENESAKMADVYQNAALTIAASTSPKSTQGILKSHESDIANKEPMLRLKLRAGCQPSEFVCLSRKDEEEYLFMVFEKGPLASRGWTLQERVLSHRVLHYGSRQIYWQCRNGFQAADGTPEGNLTPQLVSYPEFSRYLANKVRGGAIDINPQKIYGDWLDLVREYSRKNLTYGDDKFLALAGLATEVAMVVNDNYMAGIWRKDWQRGLLWFSELRSTIHYQPYRAPSWSWAVTDEPVIFTLTRTDLVRTKFDATFLGFRQELLGKSQFGGIKSATLELRGLTCPLLRSRQVVNNNTPGLLAAITYFDEPIHDELKSSLTNLYSITTLSYKYAILSLGNTIDSEISPDWEIDHDLILSQNYLLLLIGFENSEEEPEELQGCSEEKRFEKDGAEMAVTVAHALILSSGNNAGDFYQRAGYVRFDVKGLDLGIWSKLWNLQTLTIS